MITTAQSPWHHRDHSPTSPPSPVHPLRSQQQRSDDHNVTITTARLPQRCCHHSPTRAHHCTRLARTLSSSRAWHACSRACNGDVATVVTQQSQLHYRHVIIVTAILRCTRTHTLYCSLCATRACPPSLHIRKLPHSAGAECSISKMEISSFICFLFFSSASSLSFISSVCRYM